MIRFSIFLAFVFTSFCTLRFYYESIFGLTFDIFFACHCHRKSCPCFVYILACTVFSHVLLSLFFAFGLPRICCLEFCFSYSIFLYAGLLPVGFSFLVLSFVCINLSRPLISFGGCGIHKHVVKTMVFTRILHYLYGRMFNCYKAQHMANIRSIAVAVALALAVNFAG